jgi:hypothetical protein
LLWYLVPVAETQTVPLPLPELLPEYELPLEEGAVTVILQYAFFPLPSRAAQVIVAVPFPTAVTLPVLETFATFVLLLFHATVLLLAAAGATVAFSVSDFPFTSFAVLLLIETLLISILTVILQVAFTPLPSLAVQMIVAVPFPLAVTFPALVTVATFVLLLFHVTVLLFAAAGATVAFSANVFPFTIENDDLFNVILVTGCLTVTLQAAFTPLPSLAVQVIVAVPFPLPTTLPVLVTVATFVLLLFHVTAVEVASAGATVAFS